MRKRFWLEQFELLTIK